MSDGLVLRGEKIVIPAKLRPDVLAAAHEGHPGIVGMLRQLRQAVWWPGMTKDATEYVQTCVTEAPARYRTWTSHYPGERATDYTTGLSRGHLRVTRG